MVVDSEVNLMVASGVLHSLGYDPETAEDGEQALALLIDQDFDAVLMDVQRPVSTAARPPRCCADARTADAVRPSSP